MLMCVVCVYLYMYIAFGVLLEYDAFIQQSTNRNALPSKREFAKIVGQLKDEFATRYDKQMHFFITIC